MSWKVNFNGVCESLFPKEGRVGVNEQGTVVLGWERTGIGTEEV